MSGHVQANDNASRHGKDHQQEGTARITSSVQVDARQLWILESSSEVCNQGARLNCAHQHEAPECIVPEYR